MRPIRFLPLVAGLAAISALAQMSPLRLTSPAGPETRDHAIRAQGHWYQGPRGLEQAMAEAEKKGTPVAVYFYTDWCPYCRNFQSYLLDATAVDAYFEGLAKVRINPEKGAEAAALAKKYGIHGYPSFYLHPQAQAKAEPLSPFIQERRSSRIRTPGEFIAACKAVVERAGNAEKPAGEKVVGASR
jgi:thiol:disulfide interchange protein